MEKIITDHDQIQPDLAESVGNNARPLKVLVELIKKDIDAGEKAEKVGIEFFKAAGEKLIEAKSQIPHGKFVKWYTDNLGISRMAASRYMRLADPNVSHGLHFKTQREFREKVLKEKNPKPQKPKAEKPKHDKPTDTSRAPENNVDEFNKESESEKDEREINRKLGLKIIDHGYLNLVKAFHLTRVDRTARWPGSTMSASD